MPIVEFSNLNKHGNIRTRRFWQEKSNLSIDPSGFGPSIMFKLFKYDHKDRISPSIFTVGGKTYIMPGWQECLPETRLEDVNWIKPKVKRAEVSEHKFKSSSNDKIYTTKEHVSVDGVRKYTCNCPGSWMAKDKSKGCKHQQQLMSRHLESKQMKK
tara:strand:- start:133 stop:600 length:468 start_codon:yes stop_codon:yes gene_type:complete